MKSPIKASVFFFLLAITLAGCAFTTPQNKNNNPASSTGQSAAPSNTSSTPLAATSSSDVAGYNSFKIDKYSLSFLYPTGFEFEPETDNQNGYAIGANLDNDGYNFLDLQIKNRKAYESEADTDISLGKHIHSKKELVIPGGKFILTDGYGTMNYYFLDAYFKSADYIYHFELSREKYSPKILALFYQLLSSVRIGNQAAANLYLAQGTAGNYYLIDLGTGASEKFLPDGYEVISQHEYDPLPQFLILKKGNQLFNYETKTQKITALPGAAAVLKKNEQAGVHPSITEKNKFFIVITDHDVSIVNEMDGSSPIIGARSYFFDAASGQLTGAGSTNPESRESCFKYDSKNQRFFGWPCGEGIGSSVPLSILDLSGRQQKEIVANSEFGRAASELGFINVQYNDGLFFALSNGNVDKIVVVDPTAKEPQKETYTVAEAVKSQIKDKSSPYSVALARPQNTFIIGGDHYVTLLRFQDQQITESKIIGNPELYANFIFPYGGYLYFQSRNDNSIDVIDLNSWQTVKKIPLKADEEITLIKING